MRKTILFLSLIFLVFSLFFTKISHTYAADHCVDNSDCNGSNSVSSDGGYLPGCGYEIIGGSSLYYYCTPENAVPLVTCPPGQHLAQAGAFGTQVCVDNITGQPVNITADVKCDGETGINTAIGCIHVLGTPEEFLGDILRWATGISGGIAFLIILYAGFLIMTASGNPERIKAGQELMTSAIAGILLLIFSVFILKFIGIDILGLCKFGFGPAC